MTGTQFLVEALKLSPDSRRVLLTAYADTQTAIEGINKVGLDYYLLKPWEPPQERLYPPLEDLLLDWGANARPRSGGLRVAGTALSPSSHEVKTFLSRNQVPYRWVDLDADAATRELIRSMPDGLSRLPVVLFEDGTTMVQPSTRELAERIGLQTRPTSVFYDLVVIGGGPAGLAAALYGASEGLTTALVERDAPGGQAGTSSRIENYLGFPNGVSGADLARRATVQAKRFGAQIISAQDVVEIRRKDPYRIAVLSDARTCRLRRSSSRPEWKSVDSRRPVSQNCWAQACTTAARSPKPPRTATSTSSSSAARTRRARARCSSRGTRSR